MSADLLIIGVGNAFRGDDAAGLIAAQRLQARNLPGVEVVEQSGEGADLLTAWEGVPQVFLVDAAQSGAPPGTIHRYEAHREPLPAGSFRFSSHAFGVAEAIAMGRSLDQLPEHLVVYGIEGANFSIGAALTPEVETAIDRVIQSLLEEIG